MWSPRSSCAHSSSCCVAESDDSPSSSGIGKAANTLFTKCSWLFWRTPRDTQTRFLSCKASQEPSVPRLRWWFFNLSSRTSRYAANDFCISGSRQVKMDLTQSCSSFSALSNQWPSYALRAFSRRNSFWAASWASMNLWRSFAIGLGTG